MNEWLEDVLCWRYLRCVLGDLIQSVFLADRASFFGLRHSDHSHNHDQCHNNSENYLCTSRHPIPTPRRRWPSIDIFHALFEAVAVPLEIRLTRGWDGL